MMKRTIWLLLSLVMLSGCNRQEFEGFDTPFVRIVTETGTSSVVVLSNVNNINTFLVTLSAPLLTEPLTVNYEVIVGDGLQEGVDYERITQGNSLVFAPGVFDMPIRIKWLSHAIDPTKDNTIRIRLKDADRNISIGQPGTNGVQSELLIEKKNE